MNLPLFIGCCFLIIVIVVLIALTGIFWGRYKDAQKVPNKWCYSDWNCGANELITAASAADRKNTSPVIETIPVLYTNRVDNVYTNPDSIVYATGPPVPVGGCMCPIRVSFDYVMDRDPNSATYSNLIPTSTPESGFYINDNFFNQNPTQSGDGTFTWGGIGHPYGGMPACTVEQCVDYWSSSDGISIFGSKLKPLPTTLVSDPGYWPIKGFWTTPVTVTGVVPNPNKVRPVPDSTAMLYNSTSKTWGVDPAYTGDGDWSTFVTTMQIGDGSTPYNMPTYFISTILNQTA